MDHILFLVQFLNEDFHHISLFYFIKYPTHPKMFQIKMTDSKKMCIYVV